METTFAIPRRSSSSIMFEQPAEAVSASSEKSKSQLEVSTPQELVESAEDLTTLDKVVWRKLDRWILPAATMFYLLSFFDRTNIANARVAGLQQSLNLTDKQYSIALTLTYVPYVAVEIPANLLLRVIGPNLMLPSLVTLWGIATIAQGFVYNYQGLLACRFFLGLLEGGLFPSLVLYLSDFYPRSKLNIRISTFFASASLSGAFSGLLAAAILNMDGLSGKAGWAWLFILEGLFTCVFGLLSFFFFPRSMAKARFMTDIEKKYVYAKIQEEDASSFTHADSKFSWREVLEAFKLPQVWLLAPPLFFCGTTLYGQAYFEPTIVEELGYTGVRAQLFSVPPFVAAFVVSLIVAVGSDRFRCRGLATMLSAVLMIIGFSIFLGARSTSVRYGSIFFTVTGSYLSAPSLLTWQANNAAPHIRRATAIAIALIFSTSGGILATWLLGFLSTAPTYHNATVTFIAMSVGMLVFSAANLLYLIGQNKKKAAIRRTINRDDEPRTLGCHSAWFEYKL